MVLCLASNKALQRHAAPPAEAVRQDYAPYCGALQRYEQELTAHLEALQLGSQDFCVNGRARICQFGLAPACYVPPREWSLPCQMCRHHLKVHSDRACLLRRLRKTTDVDGARFGWVFVDVE